MLMCGTAFLVRRDGEWLAEPNTHLSELPDGLGGQRWWAHVPDTLMNEVRADRRRAAHHIDVDVDCRVAAGDFVDNGRVGDVVAISPLEPITPLEHGNTLPGAPSGEMSEDAEDALYARLAATPRTWPIFESCVDAGGHRSTATVYTLFSVDGVDAWRGDIDPRVLRVQPWLRPLGSATEP